MRKDHPRRCGENSVSYTHLDVYKRQVFTYANNINTIEGGSHIAGFRAAMTRVINDYARKLRILKDSDYNLTGDDIREGLSAIIGVKLTEPQFEGKAGIDQLQHLRIVEIDAGDHHAVDASVLAVLELVNSRLPVVRCV